jgi:hypothetical protein
MDSPTINPTSHAYHSSAAEDAAASTPAITSQTDLSGDFVQPANNPFAGAGRKPRSIFREVWDRTPFGVLQNLIEGKGLTCSFFPGICSLAGVDGGYENSTQGPASKARYGVTSSSDIQSGKNAGRIVDLSSVPAVEKRVSRVLDETIKNTWRAYNLMDSPSTWTGKTMTAMKKLFGEGITRPDVRARIKTGLATSLDGMQQLRDNRERIFLEVSPEPGEERTSAYTVLGEAGPTGEVVLSKPIIDKNTDESLMLTLSHEAMHFSDQRDRFYVGYSDRIGFYTREVDGHDGSIEEAPENPDSIAWAALMLGMNGREFRIPVEVWAR